jgi:hypothetical protein
MIGNGVARRCCTNKRGRSPQHPRPRPAPLACGAFCLGEPGSLDRLPSWRRGIGFHPRKWFTADARFFQLGCCDERADLPGLTAICEAVQTLKNRPALSKYH